MFQRADGCCESVHGHANNSLRNFKREIIVVFDGKPSLYGQGYLCNLMRLLL